MVMLPGVAYRVPAAKKGKKKDGLIGVEGTATPNFSSPRYNPDTGRTEVHPPYDMIPYSEDYPRPLPTEPSLTDPNDPSTPLDYDDTILYDYPGKYVGVPPNQATLIYDRNGNLLPVPRMQQHKANTDAALKQFEGADYAVVLGVQKALSDAGVLSSSAYLPGRWDAPTKAAMYVAMQEANRNGISWQSYLRMQTEQEEANGSGPRGRGPSGPTTTTQTIYSYTAKNRARLMIEQAIQEALGRAPTKAETRQFIKELRAEEEAKPTVVTTTSNPDTGQTTQTTEPGLEPDAWLADTYIEDVKPGKQERYKKAQYENLLMTMMGDGSL